MLEDSFCVPPLIPKGKIDRLTEAPIAFQTDIYTVESDNYFYMYSSTLAVTDQSNLTNFDPTGNQDYKNS